MVDKEPHDQPIHLTAQQARGGEIALTTRRRRAIFIVGLAGIVILAVLLSFWR